MKPIHEESLLARVRQARVTLQRFRRFAELAETDPLTGVANRRRFHERCVREIARAARYGTALSCVLLDIDCFKHFNDTYGHTTGDKVLQRWRTRFACNMRETDCACRYGGDEFCVLLCRCGRSGSRRLCRTLARRDRQAPRAGGRSLGQRASYRGCRRNGGKTSRPPGN